MLGRLQKWPLSQSVTSRLETSRYRDFSQFFESIGLGLENFGLEKKSRYRSRKYLVSKKSLFFYTLFLPDGNKKNKKKSHEYLEATTDVACRDLTLEPWGPHGLGTWKTGGSL